MQSKGCMLWFVYVAMLLDNKSIRTHTHTHFAHITKCTFAQCLFLCCVQSACLYVLSQCGCQWEFFVEDTILCFSLSQWTHTLAIFHLSWMCNAPNSKCEIVSGVFKARPGSHAGKGRSSGVWDLPADALAAVSRLLLMLGRVKPCTH